MKMILFIIISITAAFSASVGREVQKEENRTTLTFSAAATDSLLEARRVEQMRYKIQ